MNAVKAYKISLSVPLLTPILFAPLFFVISLMGSDLALILHFIVYSGLIGGIPYLILVAFLFWWMRGKDESQIRRVLKFSPILMLPIFWFCFALTIAGNNDGQFFGQLAAVMILYSPFVLLFGYIYVFVVFTAIDSFHTKS